MSVLDKMKKEGNVVTKLVDEFINNYIASLASASLDTQMVSTEDALNELNEVRVENGEEPIPLTEELIQMAINAATDYKRNLVEGRGSLICYESAGTEALEFYPWLNDLEEATQQGVLNIFDQADAHSWTSDKIDAELRKFEDFIFNKRARAAAFTETRVQQYQAQMRTWGYGEVEWIQRRATGVNTCATCAVLDNQVFRLGEEPALSHVNCKCFYTPYLTKSAWSPTYNKEDYDAEGYTVGPSYSRKKHPEELPYSEPKPKSGRGRKKTPLEIIEIDQYGDYVKRVSPVRKKLGDVTNYEALAITSKRGKGTKGKAVSPAKTVKPATKDKSKKKTIADFEQYTPVGTIEEAEEWAKKTYGIKHVDYSKMDVAVANDLNKSLHFHMQLAPSLKKEIRYLGDNETLIKAANDYKLDEILNRELKKGQKQDIALKIATDEYEPLVYKKKIFAMYLGTDSKNPYQGISVNHEYSKDYEFFRKTAEHDSIQGLHPIGVNNPKAVFDHEFAHALDDKFNFYTDPKIKKIIQSELPVFVTRDLSYYANHNEKEFIAEAWAEYLNNPNPRPLSKKIGEHILNSTKRTDLIGSDLTEIYYASTGKKLTQKQILLNELSKHVPPEKLAQYEKKTAKDIKKTVSYYQKKAGNTVVEPVSKVKTKVEKIITKTPEVQVKPVKVEKPAITLDDDLDKELKTYYDPSYWKSNISKLTRAEKLKELEGNKFYKISPQHAYKYPDLNPALKTRLEKEATQRAKDVEKREKIKNAVFKPAQTKEDAEKFVKSNYGIKYVDFGELHIDVINEINEALDYNMKLDPSLKDKINFLGSTQVHVELKYQEKLKKAVEKARNKEAALEKAKNAIVKETIGNSYAYFDPDRYSKYVGIAINENWGKDPVRFKDSLKNCVRLAFHPIKCDTIKSVADHELGHAIADLNAYDYSTFLKKIYEKHHNIDMTTAVSEYANKDIYEFIAECWTEYINNSNPRPVAKEVVEYMREGIIKQEQYRLERIAREAKNENYGDL